MNAETQKTISDWAEETFGPAGSLARIAARANEEMAELLKGLTFGEEPGKLVEEAADVKIICYRLAERLEFDLNSRTRYYDYGGKWAQQVAAGANYALAEVIRILLEGHPGVCVVEPVSRCVAYLEWLAKCWGYDLNAEVDRKMEVNRARVWRLDGSGHGYHVKPAVLAATGPVAVGPQNAAEAGARANGAAGGVL